MLRKSAQSLHRGEFVAVSLKSGLEGPREKPLKVFEFAFTYPMLRCARGMGYAAIFNSAQRASCGGPFAGATSDALSNASWRGLNLARCLDLARPGSTSVARARCSRPGCARTFYAQRLYLVPVLSAVAI